MTPITTVKVCVLAGAPGVVALIVIGNVPSGVVDDVVTLKLAETGLPLVGETEDDGWNLQTAPEGKFEHESVTAPLKLPAAVIENKIAALAFPGVTFTVLGDGALSPKSTICTATEKS